MLAGITYVTAVTDAAIAANAVCGCGITNTLATIIRIWPLRPAALTALPLSALLQLATYNRADRGCTCPLATLMQRSLYDCFAIAADPGSLNCRFV
jgi:hypothetical protein